MGRVSKQIRESFHTAGHVARLWTPGLEPTYTSRQLAAPGEVHEARQLATRTFVELGKINDDEVEDGVLIDDKLLPISTFFGAYDRSELQATARLLWTPDHKVDALRLPLDQINSDKAQALLDNYEPGGVAEIGSMAKKSRDTPNVANLELLHSVWRFAVDKKIGVFVCGLDPKIYPGFRAVFGDALENLSDGPVEQPETVKFPGINGPQVPLLIDVNWATARQDRTSDRSLPKPLMLLASYVITRGLEFDKSGASLLQNPSAKSY